MLRSILKAALALLLLALVAAGVGLAFAHAAIRREQAALPSLQEVVETRVSAPLPVRLEIVDTASQRMPRSAVLDASRDPHPDAPYVMSHPSFALEWADDRILLVDVGMDREAALRFGRLIELLSGGEPIEPRASAATQLGEAAARVAGVVFTHLHEDHVEGITELCRGRTRPLPVFMTEAQDERPNYTTRSARELLAAVKRGAQGDGDPPCVEISRVASGGLQPVSEFPGVFVIAAGGHTPGSQIVVAKIDDGSGPRTFAFTGDIVNNIGGIDHDLPKPLLYRLLMVPEADARQTELRRFLRRLRDEGGVRLLVSHDELSLAASGVAPWRGQRPASSPISANSSTGLGAGAAPPLNSR